MRSALVLKVTVAAALLGLHGCTDLAPIQDKVDDLTYQLGKLQLEMRTTKAASDQAMSSAQASAQATSSTRSTANEALAAAQSAQSAVDATNEKIDRMFKRTPSKIEQN